MKRSIEHAVVIGGSMAGLLAARVLADHAAHVTMVDRDDLPAGPVHRPGVPQSAHVHALLPGGAAIVERLLPGVRADIVAAGAPVLDIGADLAWLTPAGWGARFASPLELLSGTRVLIEWAVRGRLLDLPNVVAKDGVGVRGLNTTDGAVTGVSLDDGTSMPADLVVDASGRASRAPTWLAALGYDTPPETVVDADLGYSTRVVDAPIDAIPGARGAFVQVAPPEHLRGGIALPVEGGRWLLTLIGTAGDRPPRDEAGFADFAASLRHPIVRDLLAAGPAGPVAVFGATANRYRHYERLRRRPAGFLVTGDAACAFNPVYGQGMSAAALSADALARCLARTTDRRRLADRFPRALRAAVRAPWMLATASDADVAGLRTPPSVRATNRYVARLMAAGTADRRARLRLLEVMALTRRPQDLFAPRIVVSAMRGAGRETMAAPAEAVAASA